MSRIWPLPLLASEHGAEVDRLMALIFLLIGVLFIGWMVFFVYVLRRFRAGRQAEANHAGVKTRAALYVEIMVVVLEGALLLGLAIPFWQRRMVTMPGMEQNPVVVRVVAQQFLWNIHYPGPDGVFGRTSTSLVDEQSNPIGLDRADPAAADDITTRNQLHLPVGRPAICEISSKDVIHSFAVPEFRVKQDAVPGMRTPISFTPTMTTEAYAAAKGDAARTFEIVCAQLCGQGHYSMRGFVHVQTEEAFSAWLAENAPKPGGEDDFWE